MTFRTPLERRIAWTSRLRVASVLGAACAGAVLVERPLVDALRVDDKLALESWAYYQGLRAAGSIVPWIAAGLLVLGWDRVRPPTREVRWNHLRGLNLLLAPILAGLATEALKRVVSRGRPPGSREGGTHWGEPGAAEYVHKGLFAGFASDTDLGWPSSHAGVAFAGATMAWMLWPRWGPAMVLIAAGCGWTRLATGAHFVGDVVAGAAVGYCCARAIRPRRVRPRPRMIG